MSGSCVLSTHVTHKGFQRATLGMHPRRTSNPVAAIPSHTDQALLGQRECPLADVWACRLACRCATMNGVKMLCVAWRQLEIGRV